MDLFLFAQSLPTSQEAITALILFVVLAIVFGLLFRYVPLAEPWRTGIVIVAVLLVIVVLLRLFHIIA